MTEAASLLTSPTLVQRPFPTVRDYTGGSQAAYWGQSRATSTTKPRSLTYGEAPSYAPGPGRVSASDLAALNDSSTPKIEAITKFDVGKKLSQPSEHPAWRMRVMAGLGMSRLEQLVQGKEPCDSATTPAQRNCRDVRLRKAQGLLVSAISDEVLLRYEDIVFKADPILLWDRIYQDFGRGAGVNTDMVLADLYARKLQPDETVEKYINDLLRMKRILAENNDPIADCRIARLMLTNAMKVYPKITDDVTRRGMQSDDVTIYASRAELVNAEMTARAREQHDAPLTAGRGLSSARPQQANSVQHGGKGRGKKAKQNGGKYGGNRARSASCGSSSSSKASSLATKKKITRCKVCNELGHWKGDKECSGVARQAASNNQQGEQRMQSFAGGVMSTLRHDPHSSGSNPNHQDNQLEVGFTLDEVRAVLGERAVQPQEEHESKSATSEIDRSAPSSSSSTPSPAPSPTDSRGGLMAMAILDQDDITLPDELAVG
ncbi:hypothetical protein PF001_g26936 [Phytophthora fragariae]|uniref:Uncharacterized protein n=1 Tax=Phytophthora fragariae TaxID=53985 RepID=A0A6A4BL03_9STRA|nr:hypothetical protein PF001_g26936 [Phytophthora fragariae]